MIMGRGIGIWPCYCFIYYIIDQDCLIFVELCNGNASEKEIDITCK